MSEDQKKQLQTQLWNIANELRGNMDASQFRDYILGFIFYKYLSEQLNGYADNLLKADGKLYRELDRANRRRHQRNNLGDSKTNCRGVWC
jgi:type I restriction enzyme M protein